MMFEIKMLNEPRISDALIKRFINRRLNTMVEQGFTLGVDTKMIFIESVSELHELGVFDDDGIYIEFIEYQSRFNCWEISLENDSLLIISADLNVGYLFDEILSQAYQGESYA